MHTFVYLILAAVIYGVLADRLDRAADREARKRAPEARSLGLAEDFDARPDFGPRYGRRLRVSARRARGTGAAGADRPLDRGTGTEPPAD